MIAALPPTLSPEAMSPNGSPSWSAHWSTPISSKVTSIVEATLNKPSSAEFSSCSDSSTASCTHSEAGFDSQVFCWGCHMERQAVVLGEQHQHPTSASPALESLEETDNNVKTTMSRPESRASMMSRRSVHFAETVQVFETYGKDDYPTRSMNFITAEDEEGEETGAAATSKPAAPSRASQMFASFVNLTASSRSNNNVATLPDLKLYW